MVESIAAKADDPHGSESHSAEVVHEGEDAVFGDTTHDSLNTDEASINGPLDAAEVSADSLSGDIVSRSEAINNLEGNIHLEPDGTDPETVLENDGDIVFIHE